MLTAPSGNPALSGAAAARPAFRVLFAADLFPYSGSINDGRAGSAVLMAGQYTGSFCVSVSLHTCGGAARIPPNPEKPREVDLGLSTHDFWAKCS